MKKKKILKVIFVVVSAVAMLSVVLISTFASYGLMVGGFYNQDNYIASLFIDTELGLFNVPSGGDVVGHSIGSYGFSNYNIFDYSDVQINQMTSFVEYEDSLVSDRYGYYIRDNSTGDDLYPLTVEATYADIFLSPWSFIEDEGVPRRFVDATIYVNDEGGLIEGGAVLTEFSYVIRAYDNGSYHWKDYNLYGVTYCGVPSEDDYFLYAVGEDNDNDVDIEYTSAILTDANGTVWSAENLDGGYNGAIVSACNALVSLGLQIQDYCSPLSVSVALDFSSSTNDVETFSFVNYAFDQDVYNVEWGANEGDYNVQQIDINPFDWLWRGVSSFFSTEIFGIKGFSFGDILLWVISVPLIVAFLRLFAGG